MYRGKTWPLRYVEVEFSSCYKFELTALLLYFNSTEDLVVARQ